MKLYDFDYGIPTSARYVVGIDPGLQGTGLAGFVDGKLTVADVISVPSRYRGCEWWDRAAFIAAQVVIRAHMFCGSRDRTQCLVVSEYPQHFGTAGSSMGFKTGDLVRLAHLVGVIQGAVSPLANFMPVEVNRWKGQLSKALVTERLKRRLGPGTCEQVGVTSHAWDAVGIAMWALGKF